MMAVSAVFLSQPAVSAAAGSGKDFIYDVAAYVDPDNPLRIIVKWETSVPAVSRVAYRPDAASEWRKTPLTEEKTRVHKVTVVGLQENTHYFVRPVSNGVTGAVKICSTGSLPASFPSTELLVDNTQNDDVIVTGLTGCSTAIAVDRSGHIVWYHADQDGGKPGQFHLNNSTADGRLYYQSANAIKAVDYTGAEETILDAGALGDDSHHDFLITPEGNYLYLSRESVYRNDEWWCTDVIIERDNDGSLVWEWKCADHMDELMGFALSNQHQVYDINCGGYDITHGNSVDLYTDSDGNKFVLVSFRNLNRVIKIDYHTGEIVWQLGEGLDFEHVGNKEAYLEWFSCQHSARHLPNGSILLFDNGNDRMASYESPDELFSRCIVYGIDEANRLTWNPWEFRLQDFASYAGNVGFSRNANFLILFPINVECSYSSLIRVDKLGQCTWKTVFSYPTQDFGNKLTGILEIDSLYDLQE